MVKLIAVTWGSDDYMGNKVIEVPKITARNILNAYQQECGWLGNSGVIFAMAKPSQRLLEWKHHRVNYNSIPMSVPGWDEFASASYVKKVKALEKRI